jgi:hypothetical protein
VAMGKNRIPPAKKIYNHIADAEEFQCFFHFLQILNLKSDKLYLVRPNGRTVKPDRKLCFLLNWGPR